MVIFLHTEVDLKPEIVSAEVVCCDCIQNFVNATLYVHGVFDPGIYKNILLVGRRVGL